MAGQVRVRPKKENYGKKSGIKRDYRRMNKMDRAAQAKMILSAMTGNMHFVNAIPSLAEFNAAIVKLEAA